MNAGVAELEYALGLDPSLGCPVRRSTSHCEFESRRPHQTLSFGYCIPTGLRSVNLLPSVAFTANDARS